jgi:hypothetical protein
VEFRNSPHWRTSAGGTSLVALSRRRGETCVARCHETRADGRVLQLRIGAARTGGPEGGLRSGGACRLVRVHCTDAAHVGTLRVTAASSLQVAPGEFVETGFAGKKCTRERRSGGPDRMERSSAGRPVSTDGSAAAQGPLRRFVASHSLSADPLAATVLGADGSISDRDSHALALAVILSESSLRAAASRRSPRRSRAHRVPLDGGPRGGWLAHPRVVWAGLVLFVKVCGALE